MLSNFCMMREVFIIIKKEDNQTEISKTSMKQKVALMSGFLEIKRREMTFSAAAYIGA